MIEILVASLWLIALILLLTALVVLARTYLIPNRAVSLTVNGQIRIATRSGQKLLGVLNENDILVPSACAGAGTCGLCRVCILEGGPETLPVEAARLTRSERRDGMHLACQVMVRNDMKLDVDEDLLNAEDIVLTVISTRQLTPLIREIVLQMPDDRRRDIRAGSFFQITAPPFSLNFADIEVPPEFEPHWKPLRRLSLEATSETTRAYSIANRPEDTSAGRLVLNIRLALPPPSQDEAPPGIVSSWLFSRRKGDSVAVSGPFGTFAAQNTESEMVFIGGGVGMAPLRAMLFEQLEKLKTSRKITFWYGARSAADLFYEEELNALASRHQNFTWTVAMSDPQPETGWTGPVGFVHTVAYETYLKHHPEPENCEYYLCGPPLMIRAVLAMLDDLGVDAANIFNDDFGV